MTEFSPAASDVVVETLNDITAASRRAVPVRPGYDRRQFEELFTVVADTVFAEIASASQPIFVPLRRLAGLFRNARELSRRIGRGKTTIDVLEAALHTYDVAHRDS